MSILHTSLHAVLKGAAITLIVVASLAALAEQTLAQNPNEETFFETQVRPILAEHCHKCHGPIRQQSDLRLDSREAILKGGDSGAAVEPFKPDTSLLISAINHGDVVQMPPKYKLTKANIDALTKWVKMGAPWPGESGHVPEEQSRHANPKFTESQKSHWAFQSPEKMKPPNVRHVGWPKTDIDRFLLSALEAKEIEPAKIADKRTLIRRATYDLHGLPPTPPEIEAFLADDHAHAFERLIDRLLDSPRYGEHWGRHWLDVARYADSNGADENRAYAHAWRYRDYVIECFNQDVPFDRFIIEQLAGDLLPNIDRDTRNRHWIATGFLTIGPKPLLANDAIKVEMDVIDEQIETVGRAFLGMTLGCARCHDHKFDPISTEDYYAMAGIFKNTKVIDNYDLRICRDWTERALGSVEDERKHRELRAKASWCDDMRRLSDGSAEQNKFTKQMDEARKELAAIPVAMSVRESDVITNLRVHLRGSPQTLGNEVARGFPKILSRDHAPSMPVDQSGRLELARWLAQANHPLTSRVIVNRIWKWHMGEGLVRTPNDFGIVGQRPDNQPLLDFLAVRFVEGGWSFKKMHRMIMSSAAYQMSTQFNSKAMVVDPENRLLWRRNRRRLEAEEIRDSMWSIANELDFKLGGPALSTSTNHQPFSKIQNSLNLVYTSRRRAVYLPVMRSGLYDLFQIFDFADPNLATGRRDATTVAPQALFLMNSDLVWEACRSASKRLLGHDKEDTTRVRLLFELAFNRLPSELELEHARSFLHRYRAALIDSKSTGETSETTEATPTTNTANTANHPTVEDPNAAAFAALCRAMMMSNEFLYVN